MGTKLQGGHSQCVLTATTTSDGKIISGGEGGDLCIWNLDGQQTLTCKAPVPDDITCLCSSKLHPDVLLVSAGQNILFYDLRNFKEPYETYSYNEEEINCLTLNEKEDFMAACDDSGQIKVIRMQDKKVFKTLRKHTNICSTISFRPKRPWDLFSGGYDYQLMQWDFSRGRSVCTINVQELGSLDEQPNSYLINPPFLHSLDLSASGEYLACGLENSLIHILRANRRTPEYLGTLNGHSLGVSQVHFPKFMDHMVVSGGNDGKVLLWDLDGLEGGASGDAMGNGHTNGHHHPHTNGAAVNGVGEDDGLVAGVAMETPKFIIDHAAKVNWITSCASQNRQVIIVADNTKDLTVYPIPE